MATRRSAHVSRRSHKTVIRSHRLVRRAVVGKRHVAGSYASLRRHAVVGGAHGLPPRRFRYFRSYVL